MPANAFMYSRSTAFIGLHFSRRYTRQAIHDLNAVVLALTFDFVARNSQWRSASDEGLRARATTRGSDSPSGRPNRDKVLCSKDVKASRITVTMAEREGQLQIVVTDNGPGIPPEIQIRLFEPFATYGKSDGTGLGLAIVRQIIKSHDGTLTVESTPAGTAFKMRLPQPQTAETVLPG
jgi:hypothetical protein